MLVYNRTQKFARTDSDVCGCSTYWH